MITAMMNQKRGLTDTISCPAASNSITGILEQRKTPVEPQWTK